MTYTEWRDELKDNLLNVSPSERRRVLDYYAEAYADRRDAGYSEREIIAEFGAPYDAAHRILDENTDSRDDYYDSYDRDSSRRERESDERFAREEERRRRAEERIQRREDERLRREEERRKREEERLAREEERRRREEAARRDRRRYDPYDDEGYDDYAQHRDVKRDKEREDRRDNESDREDYTWVFVLLCIVLFCPICSVLISLAVFTVAMFLAPLGVIIGGAVTIGTGFGAIAGGQLAQGIAIIGSGIIILGVGILLMAVLPKLAKLMWTLLKKFYKWVKSLFSGKKERA